MDQVYSFKAKNLLPSIKLRKKLFHLTLNFLPIKKCLIHKNTF